MLILNGFSFALKRLWSHRSLVACLAAGLVVAVALAVAVPLYSDGVSYNLLGSALSKAASEGRQPPFNFIFHYVGSWYTPLEVDEFAPVDLFMKEQVAGIIGLPLASDSGSLTRYISTDNLQLYPEMETINRSQRLELVKMSFITGVFDHVRLIDGELPRPATTEGDPVEVLASLKLANDLGLQVGEKYLVYKPAQGAAPAYRLPVRLAGIWIPDDPTGEYWFYPPESFDKKLLVSEETFFGPVVQGLVQPVNEAVWRLAFDGSEVRSADVPGLLERIDRAQTRANALLANTDLEVSPAQALRQYRRAAQSLTGLLFVFGAPVLGLVMYFLGLVAAMLVRRQRSEIAVLRSRGASRGWVAGVYLIEWSLLGAAALAAGPWLGMLVARLVGQTQSFLDFSRPSNLSTEMTLSTLLFGLASACLAILFSLIPAWRAGKETIVSYKRERARARQRPFWQRIYLDVLLLLPALYGLYVLRAEGKVQLLGRAASVRLLNSTNPFENPVLFLLPTLFIVALSLLLLRLLPLALSGLAWLCGQLPGTVPVLAMRQLARSASDYLGPLMLMVITLSLAGFVASMANTLDKHLNDSIYYQIGADLNLVEGGEFTGESQASPTAPNQPSGPPTGSQTNSDEPAIWNFLPVTDHLALPGVQAAARVGRYNGRIEAAGRSADGLLVGIDLAEFPSVAFYQPYLGSEPLDSLMSRLAYDPAAILVDSSTWERFHLNTGDKVEVRLSLGETQRITFKVAGVLHYFPTLYREDGPFFVGNLEYIFESSGGMQPYDVWLRTVPGTDANRVIEGIQNMGVAVVRMQDARSSIEELYGSPNRQGVLGLLSVGFLAASLLTVIGFLLYALLSFRERFIQLGVLRAIGLSTRQMSAYLAVEQFLLILTGLAAGTGIAVITAYLFIPHLPVMVGSHPGTPPYLVEIAWADILRVYAIFGVMLLAGMTATAWSLTRMKIFQAVKMGEAV
ncbi:MAG: ABC transporter permease [Chloroflexota bacterium]|nr:MAG: ABC transporter permease [Chloroflexota bacterium]